MAAARACAGKGPPHDSCTKCANHCQMPQVVSRRGRGSSLSDAHWRQRTSSLLRPDLLRVRADREGLRIVRHELVYTKLERFALPISIACDPAAQAIGLHGKYRILKCLLADVEAAGATDKGGALHLSRILSPEQQRVLHALPAPLPKRESVVEAHLAAARAFLPLAQTLAAQLELPWPGAFEAATWRYLERELRVARPM